MEDPLLHGVTSFSPAAVVVCMYRVETCDHTLCFLHDAARSDETDTRVLSIESLLTRTI